MGRGEKRRGCELGWMRRRPWLGVGVEEGGRKGGGKREEGGRSAGGRRGALDGRDGFKSQFFFVERRAEKVEEDEDRESKKIVQRCSLVFVGMVGGWEKT